MSNGECADTVRAQCAHHFASVAEALGRVEERMAAQNGKLDNISKAVLGNGDAAKSLIVRVNTIETNWRWTAILVAGVPTVIAMTLGILKIVEMAKAL